MITTLYLVRHGQTEWNVEHRFQGHGDSPLTELGIHQAEWLGRSLRNEPLDIAYASPSARAYRTAEIIVDGRKVVPIAEEDLREINMGIWEGIAQTEAKERDPEQFSRFWQDPEAFEVSGGESFRDVAHRAIALMNRIVGEHRGKSILVVTHSVVVKLLMAHFEGRALKDIWEPPYIHPTCLCKIAIEGERADILLHGDVSHYPLKPEAMAD